MYSSPYETLPLRGLKISKIEQALLVAKAQGKLQNGVLESAPSLYVVVGKSPVTETIPPFTQPIKISDASGTYMAIDLRAFNNKLISGTEVHDPDGGAAALAIRSAVLQMIWQKSGPSTLAGLTTLPMQVFSVWVGNVLARVLGLDPRSQAELVTIASWYWLCLFSTEHDMPHEKQGLASYAAKIANVGPLSYDETLSIIYELGHLENIESLVQAIRDMETVKTDRVMAPTLYSTLSSGWFGSTDARQLVSVSLEYPPIFLSILYTAVTERGYRNSPISTVAKLFEKRNAHKEYKAAVDSIIRAYGE